MTSETAYNGLVDYELLLKEGFSSLNKFDFGQLFFNEEKNIFVFVFATNIPLKKEYLEKKFSACNEVSKSYYLINVIENVKPTSESYSFYNQSLRAKFIKKEAFVLHSKSLILAANFYFKVKKNDIPTKIFKNISDALENEF